VIQTDINIEIIVQVNGTRMVVEKEWEGPDDEIGAASNEKRLHAADEMLEVCVQQVRKAMGVATREY
jgi:hypothetical protein